MHRAGDVAPAPPPGKSGEPQRDWTKIIEQKPKFEREAGHDDGRQRGAEKKHKSTCERLERKLLVLQDRRAQQGRQGYTLKEREKIDRQTHEVENDLTRSGCR
jgi:hypothetical protein